MPLRRWGIWTWTQKNHSWPHHMDQIKVGQVEGYMSPVSFLCSSPEEGSLGGVTTWASSGSKEVISRLGLSLCENSIHLAWSIAQNMQGPWHKKKENRIREVSERPWYYGKLESQIKGQENFKLSIEQVFYFIVGNSEAFCFSPKMTQSCFN